ncbi:hypothetical protein TNIN_168931 [Trichonephila inaurata madagascariensis]|uniref:Secreted protein n=1 Tax=Trichonephila inaurata madagascariensis TaxID=2747483 RepID=A0A8X7C3A3_9ARAC|nr:hypothetical protein TNIN_168931 [Trichonephila inaurata madagascariensis]
MLSQVFLIFLHLSDWWAGWRPRVSEARTLCQGNFRCIGSSLHHERNPLQDSDLSGIPLQGRVCLWSHCISNTKDCDSTLHLAFAPLEEPLQDSEPTGLPLQGRVTARSNCISIMLRTVTLRFTQPQKSSPRLGCTSYFFFKFFPFKTWTVVHDQEVASARRKDDRTVGTAVAIAFI